MSATEDICLTGFAALQSPDEYSPRSLLGMTCAPSRQMSARHFKKRCAVSRRPDYHVNLGWSCYAAMWLSAVPLTIPDHFIPMRATGAVRAAFERQAVKDWEAFLAARARELRPAGSLVIVLAGRDDIG